METKSFKTKKFRPPKDDVLVELKGLDLDLQDGDVLTISSKVVAVHEGRCVPISDEVDKDELIQKEADLVINESDSRWCITVKNSAILASAGIDESNADGHYILLPSKPFEFARSAWRLLTEKYQIKNLGVVVTDSTSRPLRYGTVGTSIAWSGIEPVTYFTGQTDIYGRANKFTRINVADSLAGVGVYAMGELDEQTPMVRVRNAPHVKFTDRDTRGELFIPPREDIYWPLLKHFFDN